MIGRAGRSLVLMALGALSSCGRAPPPGALPPELLFGRSGLGPGEFNYPRAAVISPLGRLYVVDKAGRIQAFNQTGQFILAWRMPRIEAGKPTGLGVGPDGKVYAADTHYSRVMVFDPDGRLVGQFGQPGDGPGQFRLPTDVAVDAAGYIYVSEYGGNDRVSKFSPGWEYCLSFGGPDAGVARLERPQSLLIAPDGTIWVADACNHRICHFDADGRFLGAFGRAGQGPGELWFPYSVDMLSDGTLVVCEYGNNRVQRFDAAGRSLGIWGNAGREPGQLAYPWALAVGPNDRVFVVDSGNNRIQAIAGRGRRTWHAPQPGER